MKHGRLHKEFILGGLFTAWALVFMQCAHAAPSATLADIPATIQSVTAFNGTASASAAEVELTLVHNDLGYYWNGSSFQAGAASVRAVLSTSGSRQSWRYAFAEPLAAGNYTVQVRARDDNGSRSNAATDRFSVSHQFTSVGNGSWGPVIETPVVPVAAANLPDGKILTWAAYKVDDYKPTSKDFAQTYTTIFDPNSGRSTLNLVTETKHDMFCMGANILEDGRVLMNGGSSAGQTSIFDNNNQRWVSDDPLNIARAYQGNAMLEDGRVLTLGGSWKYSELCRGHTDNDGTCVDKTAEIWDPDNGWSVLRGIPATPLSTDDVDGLFRGDNHMWLFSIPGGKVLHAGPARKMHLLDVSGNGSVSAVGNRADDADAMNGNAAMYDVGKILTTGGAPNYENDDATASAFVIEASGNSVRARRVSSMASARAYHNSVVLPNGEVIVVGGQAYPVLFSDARSAMKPELWNPTTERFRELAPMAVPRNYHSIALLTEDGKVLAGGGGLCGSCGSKNHSDIEIFTPPYLFDHDGNAAQRPRIVSAPGSSTYGKQISVKTDKAVRSLVLMRASAVTHALNNAQRRIPLDVTRTSDNINIAVIPQDSASVIPGNYMLFALDHSGVPSVAKTINIKHRSDGPTNPPSGHPDCRSSSSDPDGDGWGWENNRTCLVRSDANDPDDVDDPDDSTNSQGQCEDRGDYPWGWNPVTLSSCRLDVDQQQPECIDTDGDGWGWDGSRSCRMDAAL